MHQDWDSVRKGLLQTSGLGQCVITDIRTGARKGLIQAVPITRKGLRGEYAYSINTGQKCRKNVVHDGLIFTHAIPYRACFDIHVQL